MSFFAEYGLFALKSLTLVISILVCLAGIFALSRKDKGSLSKIRVTDLNQRFADRDESINEVILSKKALKALKKESKQKSQKETNSSKPRLFVLDFVGDIKASEVESLRDLTSSILSIVKPEDEVVVRLESPGGLVSHYGLAANQLNRFKTAGIPLTICVDKVAASGGYLMAAVADTLIAAPFAIIGSIGVISSLPNFHRLLKKNDIDYEQFTAGEYKRTVTLFGETTETARHKRQAELDSIHTVFKDFLLKNRPALDVDKVATGEYWLACDSLDLALVDELNTSDDYLFHQKADKAIYHLSLDRPKSFIEKLMSKGEHTVLGFITEKLPF